MSSLAEVHAATCRIVDPDGRLRGSGFLVLPGGYLLTCHHVIAGADALLVGVMGSDSVHSARYLAEYSDPVADIAALHAPSVDTPAVGLGNLRDVATADAVGYRPGELEQEPKGHTFSGTLGPGQELRMPVPLRLREQAEGVASRREWNRVPAEFRVGEVRNLAVPGGLEQGVSGGPVYDRGLRRVVGLLRAVEGEQQAYVIPMDTVFTRWIGLAEHNRAEVHEAPLDELAANYGITLVKEGATPVRPTAWRTFQQLLDRHERFGGRGDELIALDSLLKPGERPYAFVTGPAGFGKTALLCRWVRSLRRSRHRCVVHFLTPTLDEGLDARHCFRNLCEQLCEIHGLGGVLPADARLLRFLYADLLRFPAPDVVRIVVVLDGLDEVLGRWSIGPDVFPRDLPANVRVVFSARTIADKDWLVDFGLRDHHAIRISLDRLGRDDLVDVLVASGVAPTGGGRLDVLADRLFELSEGDPFYVQDLLHDMESNDAGIADLRQYPIGHSTYLREWWRSARGQHPGQGFVDLMGTLASLRAPLRRPELVRVSPDDELRGADIGLLLETAARYVDGDEERGYQLSHGRIRAFVQQVLEEEMERYRIRLAEFCLRWDAADATPSTAEYGLLHGIGHLIEVHRIGEAVDLLTARWIGEKWSRSGSYRGVIDDLRVLAEELAERPDDPLVARLPAVLIARETARHIMAGLPVPLLVAWVRLGGVESVLETLAALSELRGGAAEPIVAVARELVHPDFLTRSDVDPTWARSSAAELLGRAIGTLALEPTSWRKLKLLEHIADLLMDESFEREQLKALIAQLGAFAQSLQEPMLRACALGQAARLAAMTDDSRARVLLEEAEAALARIERPADRLFARGSQLAALRHLDPARLPGVVRATVGDLRAPPSLSSLLGDPVAHVVAGWQPHLDAAAGWVVPELKRLGELYLDRDPEFATLPSEILVELSRCGHTDHALELLERQWQRSRSSGLWLLLRVADILAVQHREVIRDYLVRAYVLSGETLDHQHREYRSQLAAAFASLGDWERCIALLSGLADRNSLGLAERSDLKDSLVKCVELVGRDESPLAQVVDRVERLVGLGAALESDDLAEVEAAAAIALAPRVPEAARAYLSQAVHRCLARTPEGDADELRYIQALIALEQDDHGEVDRAVRRCSQPDYRVKIYHALLQAVLSGSGGAVDTIVTEITSTVITAGGRISTDGLVAACDAARLLAPEHRAASLALCDAVRQVSWAQPTHADRIRVAVAEIRAQLLLDRAAALSRFRSIVVDMLERATTRTEPTIRHDAKAVFEGLMTLNDTEPDEAHRLLQTAHRLADGPFVDARMIEVAGSYAAALAKLDPTVAPTLVESLLAALEGLPYEGDRIAYAARWLAEVTGRPPFPPDGFEEVCSAIAALVEAAPKPAAALADRALDYALGRPRSEERKGGAIALLERLAAVSPPGQEALAGFYMVAGGRLLATMGSDATDEVMASASAAAIAAGHLELARTLQAQIAGAQRQAQIAETITMAERAGQVTAVTPLERAYMSMLGANSRVYLWGVREDPVGFIKGIVTGLTQRPDTVSRERLLSYVATGLVLPLLKVHGPEAVTAMVDEIDRIDARFAEAADFISLRASQGPGVLS